MAKKAFKKTNAMRILDSEKISYNYYTYEIIGGHLDGITVAKNIGKDPKRVFKTLVTQGASKDYFVFVIPVAETLDLKKAATAVGEKRIEMIPMKKLLAITGYIHGGCSPVGMKKRFMTVFHKTVSEGESIICSAGKPGVQLEVEVYTLIDLVLGKEADIINDPSADSYEGG